MWGAVLAAGGVMWVLSGLLVRNRLPAAVRTAGLVTGAAVVGLGAIGMQDRASTLEWVLTPLVVGALALLHDRLLFAGDGPRRT
jgi:hypothetical protein